MYRYNGEAEITYTYDELEQHVKEIWNSYTDYEYEIFVSTTYEEWVFTQIKKGDTVVIDNYLNEYWKI